MRPKRFSKPDRAAAAFPVEEVEVQRRPRQPLESHLHLFLNLFDCEQIAVFVPNADKSFTNFSSLGISTGDVENLIATLTQRNRDCTNPEFISGEVIDSPSGSEFQVLALTQEKEFHAFLLLPEKASSPQDAILYSHMVQLLTDSVVQHHRENVIRHHSERQDRFLSNLPSGIISVDRDATIHFCTYPVIRILHLHEFPVGKLSDYLPEKQESPILEVIERVITDKKMYVRQWDTLLPDGSDISLRVTGSPQTGNESNQVLLLLEDASLRREVKELRHLDDLKRDFISMVSHELRTPITSVKGAAALLSTIHADAFNESQKALLQMLERNVDRMTNVVNKIVDVALLEQDSVELMLYEGDLKALVEDVITQRREEFEASRLNVDFHFEEDATVFEFDSERLSQAIDAVIHNAIKFGRRESTVTIDIERSGNFVYLRVSDEGEGIPDAYRRKVFQKFFQIEETMTRSKSGSGLGLYFAKHIAELHGGDLVILDSDRGTTLEFSFRAISKDSEIT